MTSFLQKYKIRLIGGVLVIAVLAISFFIGGNAARPDKSPATADSATTFVTATTATTEPPTTVVPTASTAAETATTVLPTTATVETNAVSTVVTVPEEKTEPVTDKYKTDPIPTNKPKPVEPQEQTTGDETLSCTLSISCATVLENMDKLDEELWELVPEDGWILKPEQIVFTEGESVFDVLVRVCKEKNIHLDHSFTPVYNSAYIKGIGNLYEFDCGDQSGWVYAVNDWIPNYGCSRYVLKNGDDISFRYTCRLGYDVGRTKS